eukprot:3997034-Heterocapsa_arctica.AAC.1
MDYTSPQPPGLRLVLHMRRITCHRRPPHSNSPAAGPPRAETRQGEAASCYHPWPTARGEAHCTLDLGTQATLPGTGPGPPAGKPRQRT